MEAKPERADSRDNEFRLAADIETVTWSIDIRPNLAYYLILTFNLQKGSMMRRIPIFACLWLFAATSFASAQSWEARCLAADHIRDATITCLRASMLIQREQIKLQRSLLDVIVKQTNPALRETLRSTRELASLINTANQSQMPYFLVSDLRNFEDAIFACDETELCEESAQSTADSLCKRLGYGAQHDYEFQNREGVARLKWLVCRS